jgi:hypothetical protein
MIRWGWALCLAWLTPCAVAAAPQSDFSGAAEAGPPQFNITGSVRGGYFSSSRQLDGQRDPVAASLWLKANPRFGDSTSLVAEAWARNDDTLGTGRAEGKLREGYLYFKDDDIDFRLGKQLIVWGRADALNPTDNLSPRDFTLLVPESDDQRLGTWAANFTIHRGDYAYSAIWLPRFDPNIVPLDHSTGMGYAQPSFHSRQSALRIDHTGGEVDWSVSYFSGLDPNPVLKPGGTGGAYPDLILDHQRIRVLGADMSTVVGRYGLRAEAAYTWAPDFFPGTAYAKRPALFAVAGGDRTFYDYLNVNLQYFIRRTMQYRDPSQISDPVERGIETQNAIIANQQDRFQHGITFRISDKWLHETLEGEVAGVFSLTRRDYAIRPKLVYAFTDRLKGTLAMEIYRGGKDAFYGQLRDISSVSTELKYSF